MTTYIAFLRGINVGAHNRMKMDDLSATCENVGFETVRTYIQSGNVVLDADGLDPDAVADQVHTAIEDDFGYDVDVMVRTLAELDAIVDAQPYDTPPADGVKLYVTFLADEPADDRIQTLVDAQSDVEAFHVSGRDVYSQLDKNHLAPGEFTDAGKTLGVSATRRTWDVVTAVHDLARN